MILAAGRRSESGDASLVRERGGMVAENGTSGKSPSRTSAAAPRFPPAPRQNQNRTCVLK
ncbi:hypothetical protein B0A90_09660 [Pseudomonas syringae]|nr:hypothetical protein B0A90_09660 [Pseudomonas syringae]